MFKNNFKIAIRQLLKQKWYGAIKIGGFSLGIVACLLIALYIKDELSYDRFYPDTGRIFRIVGHEQDKGITNKWVSFPAIMAKVITKDFPEVEQSARLMPNSVFPGAGSNEFMTADKNENTYEEGFTYADGEIFNIFKIPLVYGDPAHALSDPNTIVLSKSKADKYFPGQNPLGKIIFLNNDKRKPYRVGGVMRDFPANSHFQYSFLLTLTGIEWWKGEQTSWDANNYVNYILLRPGTHLAQFEKKLTADISRNYYLPVLLAEGDKNAEKELSTFELHLQPITDIHLKSYDIQDNLTHGDIRFIWLFGAVACFILILACINFINLSTAKSANRAKEVGLRKVIGSYRSSLVSQFLIESLLFSFGSFAIGLVLTWALLPYFNTLSAKSLTIPWSAWWLLPFLFLSATITGLVAGLYPAFYLSSFKPIQVLKGQLSRGSKNSGLRNVLVVFQFVTSIVLIISTVVIYSQTQYILNAKLGYNKDQVILVQGTNTLGNEVRNFKNELLKLPQIKNVSISDYLPVTGTKRNGNPFWNEGKVNIENNVTGQLWIVDNDYVKTMGMKIVSGRDFSAAMLSDSQSVIINQALAKKLNLKEAVGKRITNGDGVFTVIGVVENFNFESLRENIDGLCLHLGNSPSIVSVKVNTADMAPAITAVSAVWKRFSSGQPIRYSYLDERFAIMYADVQRTGRILTSFAVLAIVIACLGLFALSSFMTEQRSKEIGVRKVLGASIADITALMSKDFVKLVLLAIVIASPLAWWAMTKWLEDFVYRTSIGWWVFAGSGGIALLIALFTVSFQSIKAAMTNPVKSLRSE